MRTTSPRPSPYRPRKKPLQRRAQDTVTALLDATARVLVSRGYAGTTTNHVAERAGVSIGSLYEWFPGKDALLTALVERHLDRAEALLTQRATQLAPRAATLAPVELARVLADTMLALHEDDPRLHRALFEEVPHGPPVRARVRRLEAQMQHALAELFEAHPRVRVRDPELAAHLVVQLLEVTAHRWATERGGKLVARERLLDELAQLVGSYLAAPAC